jgi:tRNA threonylcarbamoyladenosine biosynthesis protein TsaE
MEWVTHSDGATEAVGAQLVMALSGTGVIFLNGDLGAGKTTFCRGVLRALGYTGAVKSPTFTLVEPYEFRELNIYHFDLYRLGHPDELNYLGVDEYFHDQALCLIEWSQKGLGLLPKPDLEVTMMVTGDTERCLSVSAETPRGWSALAGLSA